MSWVGLGFLIVKGFDEAFGIQVEPRRWVGFFVLASALDVGSRLKEFKELHRKTKPK